MNNYNMPDGNYWRNNVGNMAKGLNYTYPYNNVALNGLQQPLNALPCKAVTSIDEAKGQILENPLVPNIFTNLSNKEIYVKYIDNETGSAKVIKFVEEQAKKEEIKTEDTLKDRIDNLEENYKMMHRELIKLKGIEDEQHDESSKSSSKAKNVK